MNKTFFGIALAKTSVSILLFVFLIVLGCGPRQIKSQAIIPGSYDIENKQPFTVSLHVDGGREFSPLRIPQISNEALMDALHKAIILSDLFDEIVKFGENYKLDLYIFKVSQPIAGFEMTVRVEIGWTLTHTASMEIVWQESILTSDTSDVDEEFNALKRLKLITERAAKKNLKEGIQQISRLDLQQKTTDKVKTTLAVAPITKAQIERSEEDADFTTINLLDHTYHMGDNSVKRFKNPKPQGIVFERKFNIADFNPSTIFVTIWVSDLVPKRHDQFLKGYYKTKLEINNSKVSILNKHISGIKDKPIIEQITIEVDKHIVKKGSNKIKIIAGFRWEKNNYDDFEIHKIIVRCKK